MITIVFLKLTVRPLESVSLPSSKTCSKILRIYGYNNIESSKIPPDWHLWIHSLTIKKPENIINKFSWQKEHEENLTGTTRAHRPEGSLASDVKKNSKKYETWKF